MTWTINQSPKAGLTINYICSNQELEQLHDEGHARLFPPNLVSS